MRNDYLWRFLLSLDVAANVLTGGSSHQTLSARAHLTANRKHPYWAWTERAIDRLFWWEDDHCRRQWYWELEHPIETMKGVDYARTLAGALFFVLIVFVLARGYTALTG